MPKSPKPPKLLVANRSEIACRIFQACKELGIPTVGIVAPGDEEARHATYADELLPVSSYLSAEAILEAAVKSGTTLIHPGYGFLSERPHFVRATEKAGLTFIGPRAETMEVMGGKIAAKELAQKVGVPTLPWAKVPRGQDIQKIAAEIGFPLLLKASAGGGGKGMRKVSKSSELAEAAESASNEALNAFGDGTLFLERCIDQPRHIEVQVFGDGTGFGVHLRERECSAQRRHQKVWEEAPAPHLSKKTLESLYEASLKLVKATQYRSAGTLEYLLDSSQPHEPFYFLEMNTRLQVEHPVTEAITGVDLVISQIQQALHPSERILSFIPEPRGHAIEVRLYAEDPAQGFMPTPGQIQSVRWPTGAGIRVESGIESGQTISTSFDSMLAKLVVHAPTRSLAIERMKFALSDTAILGIGTNQNYLMTLANHPALIQGRIDTSFLERELGTFAPDLGPTELDWVRLLHLKKGLASQTDPSSSATKKTFPSPWNKTA